MGDHFPGPGNMVETVAHVVRDFDAMAAECGGLEAATIHAMTTRIQAAHAREVERAVANERVRDVHTCHDQCTKTELCRMTRRAEAAEAKLSETLPCNVAVWPATVINAGCTIGTLLACIDLRRKEVPEVDAQAVADFADLLAKMRKAPQDAAIASGGEG